MTAPPCSCEEALALRAALVECARRILRWREQHSEESCAVLNLSEKMLREVIAPAIAGEGVDRG